MTIDINNMSSNETRRFMENLENRLGAECAWKSLRAWQDTMFELGGSNVSSVPVTPVKVPAYTPVINRPKTKGGSKARITGYTRTPRSWEEKGIKMGWRWVHIPSRAVFTCEKPENVMGGMKFAYWAVSDYGVGVNTGYNPSAALCAYVNHCTSLSGYAKKESGNPNAAIDPTKWYIVELGKTWYEVKKEHGWK